MRLIKMHRCFTLILLWALLGTGCNLQFLAGPPAPAAIESEGFVMVTAGAHDTLASLARTYLDDDEKAWQIAAFNSITAITPGQRVIIPRTPFNYGGIQPDGFQTVPVLLYPELSNDASKSKAVNARDFDEHMQYLNENGYTTVTLDQFHAFLSFEDQLPPDAVLISFDTTHRWVHDIAFPILRRRGMHAAIFIRLNEIGARDRMTWSQLAEMSADGMDIGVRGPRIKLPAKDNPNPYSEALEREFMAPKSAFKVNLKRPCRYFAYDSGASDDLTIGMLKKHGYRAAFTRKRGSNPFFADNYKIKRTTIYGHIDLAQFRRSLVTFRAAELR